MSHLLSGKSKRHLLTVNLEDYFQVGTLRSVVRPRHWYRFENRVAENTVKTLDLLDAHQAKATFFALGWIADELPEVIRMVVERGHEIASKGYFHRAIGEMSPNEFREDIVRSREAIERASGTKVHGYRIARGWFSPDDLWALDILAEEGFSYDSSVRPFLRSMAGNKGGRKLHVHHAGKRSLWEVPLSTWTFMGFSIPIAGGNYLRQFPSGLMLRAAQGWDSQVDSPFVMYFHVWEIDPDQPRVKAAPMWQRVRQYRNLGKMERVISDYLDHFHFTSIGDYLGLPGLLPSPDFVVPEPRHQGVRVREEPAHPVGPPLSTLPAENTPRLPVTLVIPCYNEEESLPYLAKTLQSVEATLSPKYDLRYVFVDDCSKDRTWLVLNRLFGEKDGVKLVQQETNCGVAAAILTGLRAATTEVVCSMDCDCTYDPHEFGKMIPLLSPDAAMITASPYHPQGTVLNVPGWRLFLSKGLSAIYRLILTQKLATYTSCFRVYRKSAVENLKLREGGFLGVAEMVAKLDLQGSKVIEYPAVLEVRLLGESKMKVAKTILGHLRLLSHVIRDKMRSDKPPIPVPADSPVEHPDFETESTKLPRV
jgi:polysaccharide deacetylase family protein (PEP-CTERM system associated)